MMGIYKYIYINTQIHPPFRSSKFSKQALSSPETALRRASEPSMWPSVLRDSPVGRRRVDWWLAGEKRVDLRSVDS